MSQPHPAFEHTDPKTLTKKDFESDQEVRWCPGCGDYSILAQVQRTMPELGISRENHVVVAGIGCSSRFPYYMNTYGLHGIHGRAPAIATGLKSARPELTVWVVTGDGDGLSIGGNHLMHACRRNVDLKIMLFNNRIYGLTKGQYSPTSETGKRTASTPYGSVDYPLDPVLFALSSGATFVARTLDIDAKGFQSILKRMHQHTGASFLEILQNCPIYNDDAFVHLTDKKARPRNALMLEHGKKMVFGADNEHGIALSSDMRLSVVASDDPSILVHDETNETLATLLGRMSGMSGFPVPLGVFYRTERPTYEAMVSEQIAKQRERGGTIQGLLEGGETWKIG
jgi:2-oxoglutarate/2-oxoacid ferredoxin oxidoreductase subunit beta